jgi:hypothetical protein
MELNRINLTTLEHLNKRLLQGVLAGVLALLLVVSAWNLYLGLRYHGERRTYQSRIDRLGKGLGPSAATASPDDAAWRAALQEGRFLNRLVAIDIFPWPLVLDVVEETIPQGVALSRLSPTENLNVLILEGRAESVERLTQFQSALEKAPVFAGVALQTMALEGRGTDGPVPGAAGSGLSFELRCRFNLSKLFPEEERGGLGWTLVEPEA